jgi:hypothetical protein
LLVVVIVVAVLAVARAHFHALGGLGVCARCFSPDFLRFVFAACSAGAAFDFILVHGLERFAYAEEEHHEPPLGELGVVDEVRVDHVLQIAAPVVGKQDVYGFGGGVGLVGFN